MKKIVTLFVLLCSIAWAQSQDAESLKATNAPVLGLGARIAAGYGMLWGMEDDWSGGENDETPGGLDLEAGVAGRFVITPVIHFTPELLFHYAKYTQEDESGDREFTQMNAQIPLLIRANATPKFYAYVGPQLKFNLDNDVSIKAKVSNKASSGTTIHVIPDKVEQAKFGIGAAAGAGYYVIENLSVDMRIYLGLNELYPDSKGTFIDITGARDLSFKLGINYWIF